MQVYLDNSATTPLSEETKRYLIKLLETYGKEIGKEIGREQLADAIKRLRSGENSESIEASGIDRATVELAQTLK